MNSELRTAVVEPVGKLGRFHHHGAVGAWRGCLGGVSAHRSAQEAKRANAQAMYHERRAVFGAFLDLSMHMQERGQAPDKAVVGRFYRYHHTAAFCLDTALAEDIKDYFEVALQLADYCSANPGLPKLPPEAKAWHDHVSARSLSLLERVKKAVPVE